MMTCVLALFVFGVFTEQKRGRCFGRINIKMTSEHCSPFSTVVYSVLPEAHQAENTACSRREVEESNQA